MSEDQENPTDEGPAHTARLEGLLAERDELLRLANARIAGLEQAAGRLESEAGSLKQANLELEQRLGETGSALSRAVASYRALMVESSPQVPPEFITGDNIEAIDDSVRMARELVSKVRGELEAEIRMTRIPAGAPQRAPVDLSALSSREKIQYGIGGN